MKIINLLTLSLAFAASAASADQLHVPYTPEFINFYKEFRQAIVDGNKNEILKMTCFPFLSHESGEMLDERNVKIQKKVFYSRDLHKFYLQNSAGSIFSSSLDPQPAHQIYDSAEDVIKKNLDPTSPADITMHLRGWFRVSSHSASVSNLKFSEKREKWCWSGADTSEPISETLRHK